jgi:hypothetical protein
MLCLLLLTACVLTESLLTREQALEQAHQRALAKKRFSEADVTPYLFFYEVPSPCANISLIIGELANYQNRVISVTINTIVFQSPQFPGAIVNYPASVTANSPHGPCDSFVTGGNLGWSGARVDSFSPQWTSTSSNVVFYPHNASNPQQSVFLSCGLPQMATLGQGPFPYTSCPQGDFYMQVVQIAHTSPAFLVVNWNLNTFDNLVYQDTWVIGNNTLPRNFTTVAVTSGSPTTASATTTSSSTSSSSGSQSTAASSTAASTTTTTAAPITAPPGNCVALGGSCGDSSQCCGFSAPPPAYSWGCTGNNLAPPVVGCWNNVCSTCQYQVGGSCNGATCCGAHLQCARHVSFCDQSVKCDVLQAPHIRPDGPRTQLLCIPNNVPPVN